jgi:glycosyltransferase involved in cell wall biosynthesis
MNTKAADSVQRVHKVVVAQPGAREHYEIAAMLAAQGRLAGLITDGWSPYRRPIPSRVSTHLPSLLQKYLARHRPDIPRSLVRSISRGGIESWVRQRLARDKGELFHAYLKCGSSFAKATVRRLSEIDHACFIGYSSASLGALRYERQRNRRTILDQIDPSRVEDEIVLEEERRFPAMSLSMQPIPERYFARLEEEWAEASAVLVNSTWSKRALVAQHVPEEKIAVVPLPFAPSMGISRQPRGAVLRVLWLGTLSLRKGLPYAIEAARMLVRAPVSFTLAGPLGVHASGLNLPPNTRYVGQVPRPLAAQLYASHDAFLFPTLSDGFGLTQVEAISYGLPVIATRCCGQVVEDGVSGFVVPPRDSRAIADAIESLLTPAKLGSMSSAAKEAATAFLPERIWPRYATVIDAEPCFSCAPAARGPVCVRTG